MDVQRVELLGPKTRDRQPHDGDVAGDGGAALVPQVVSLDGGQELARHGGGRHLGEVVVDARLDHLARAGHGRHDAVGLLGEDLVELADHHGHGAANARERGRIDLRLLDHELEKLRDAGGLGRRGHRRAVLERDPLAALLGPAAVLRGGKGHPVRVLLGKPRRGEVGAEGSHGEHVLAPVAGEQQAQDAAVGKAQHVHLGNADSRADLAGVGGHELIGERRAAAARRSLGAGVNGDDGAPARADRVDHGAKDAVLLAVAVEHEHGRHGEPDAEGRARLVNDASGRVCPGNDGGAVFRGHLDARRERRGRQRVRARDVHGRGRGGHVGSFRSGREVLLARV